MVFSPANGRSYNKNRLFPQLLQPLGYGFCASGIFPSPVVEQRPHNAADDPTFRRLFSAR
jgi:hypothetical protein